MLTLKRQFKDEDLPRLYELTGGSFDEMKAAVKELGAQWLPVEKMWLLNGQQNYNALKEKYSVKSVLPFRPASFDPRQRGAVLWSATHIEVRVSFEHQGRYGFAAAPLVKMVRIERTGQDQATLILLAVAEHDRVAAEVMAAFNAAWDKTWKNASVAAAAKAAIA